MPQGGAGGRQEEGELAGAEEVEEGAKGAKKAKGAGAAAALRSGLASCNLQHCCTEQERERGLHQRTLTTCGNCWQKAALAQPSMSQ